MSRSSLLERYVLIRRFDQGGRKREAFSFVLKMPQTSHRPFVVTGATRVALGGDENSAI